MHTACSQRVLERAWHPQNSSGVMSESVGWVTVVDKDPWLQSSLLPGLSLCWAQVGRLLLGQRSLAMLSTPKSTLVYEGIELATHPVLLRARPVTSCGWKPSCLCVYPPLILLQWHNTTGASAAVSKTCQSPQLEPEALELVQEILRRECKGWTTWLLYT